MTPFRMPRSAALPLLALGLAMALTGCNRPTCDASSMSAPMIDSFISSAYSWTGWSFMWGPADDGCRPRQYRLVVSDTYRELVPDRYNYLDYYTADTSGEPGPADSSYNQLQADPNTLRLI